MKNFVAAVAGGKQGERHRTEIFVPSKVAGTGDAGAAVAIPPRQRAGSLPPCGSGLFGSGSTGAGRQTALLCLPIAQGAFRDAGESTGNGYILIISGQYLEDERFVVGRIATGHGAGVSS